MNWAEQQEIIAVTLFFQKRLGSADSLTLVLLAGIGAGGVKTAFQSFNFASIASSLSCIPLSAILN